MTWHKDPITRGHWIGKGHKGTYRIGKRFQGGRWDWWVAKPDGTIQDGFGTLKGAKMVAEFSYDWTL